MDSIKKARITTNFAYTQALSGFIHSKHSQICNLVFQTPNDIKRIISLTPNCSAIMPNSLAVDDRLFHKITALPVGSAVIKNRMSFYFPQIDESLNGSIECIQSNKLNIFSSCSDNNTNVNNNIIMLLKNLQRFRGVSEKRDGFSDIPVEKQVETIERLYCFGYAFLAGDSVRTAQIIPRCIGVGKGLTPSSDDMLIGIMAVLIGAAICNHPAASKKLKNHLESHLENLLPLETTIVNLTTDVSVEYLFCARECRFNDILLRLVEGIFNGVSDKLIMNIEEISMIGSTSGMDMLIGVAIGCNCIRQKREYADTKA